MESERGWLHFLCPNSCFNEPSGNNTDISESGVKNTHRCLGEGLKRNITDAVVSRQ